MSSLGVVLLGNPVGLPTLAASSVAAPFFLFFLSFKCSCLLLTTLFGASKDVVLSYSVHSLRHRGNMELTTGHK